MRSVFDRLRTVVFVFASALAAFIVVSQIDRPQIVYAEMSGKSAADFWHIAPQPPNIAEIDRLTDLRSRRQEVLKRMNNRSIMVLFSTEPRVYTNDVDYPYRQENNLYYLTGIRQNGVTLVLIPGAKKTREIIFMPERNPMFETWNGRMMSFDEARKRSGVDEIWNVRELNSFLAFIAPRAEQAISKRAAAPKPDEKQAARWQDEFSTLIDAVKADQGELWLLNSQGRDQREYKQEVDFASSISSAAAGLKVKPAQPIFAELRQIKSDIEIKLMQHAVDITGEAFHRVFAAAVPGLYEYEMQAEFEYTFRRRNADNWGYPCIVGAGANATTLHYETNQDRMDDNSLLLMDCAAEFDHYTADITRTIPVNGKFTKEQADIYRIVYDAQMEAIKASRPGNMMSFRSGAKGGVQSVNDVATEKIKEGLLRLGLITSRDNNEYRTWFMHGTSHWLGMNVHDVGDPRRPLAPGMIFTVEPGIYLRPDALDVLPKTPENEKFIKAVRPAFEKYKGIGVRIEDDVLITENGPKVLSAAIPSKLEDVESTMARLRQELKRSGWPLVAIK
ncbi:MAG: aminopeptidase P family protein [Acidobacteria bacterium]|nr:aminopeptidase P family protein [Acidobacteriota bacterium]